MTDHELASDDPGATDDAAWATDGPASARWAYGTGFRDPFVDIDLASAPAGDPSSWRPGA